MRQLEQLATVGRMCATIAHEINNPLECLNNLLYLVQSEVNTKDGQWYVQQAEQQVSRLAETTQRTLDLFRGKQQLPRVVDMGQLVMEMLANTPAVREIKLVPAIEADLLVLAIPGELRQVLFNLVNNAMQFTPDGGKVLLTVKRSGQRSAEIRVKDEGPGISEANRAKIFRPFYTTRANGGTGVGLWISREMVERIGGSLTFESEPTRRTGTEFIVTLPLAVEHAA
jgi:signal transduction histidine kinase